jgi:hypothetical protein
MKPERWQQVDRLFQATEDEQATDRDNAKEFAAASGGSLDD